MEEMDNYLDFGMTSDHGEAERFIQNMEDASSIPEKAKTKMDQLKATMITISVAVGVVACLFIIGVCFAGRICIKSFRRRNIGRDESALSDVSSFIYENGKV